MKFLTKGKFLLCTIGGLILTNIACKAEAPTPLVFDFNSGSLPEGSLFQDDRKIQGRRSNDISIIQEAINGRNAQSVSLPGGKNGLRLSLPQDDSLFGKLTSLSIALFVKLNSLPQSPIFLHRLKGSRSTPGYFSFHANSTPGQDSSEKMEFRITTNDGGEIITATEACEISQGQWNHFAMVYNGSEVRFYCNGQLVGEPISTFIEGIPAIDATLCDLSTYNFGGNVAEMVVLPDRALSDAQVQALFDKGPSGVDFPSLK